MRKIAQVVILATLLTLLASCETAGSVFLETSGLWAHSPPQWSPDGSSIVMHMDREGDWGNVGLGEVASDGSWLHWISAALPSADYELDFSPDVSPDGSRIAFMTYRFKARPLRLLFAGVVNSEIVTSALDGSDIRRLTKSEGFDESPVWSPDGSSIAYISTGGRLQVMEADGSEVRMLTDSVVALGGPPVWSPKGRYIALTARADVYHQTPRYVLYTVTQDGAQLNLVAETVTQRVPPGRYPMTSRPTWSPEGTQLAFAKKDGDMAGIYISDPDGSNLRLVLPDVEAVHLAWSPDGSEIAFAADGVISLVRPDGSGLRRLSPSTLSGVIQGLAWSPEGSRLAISGDFRPGDGSSGWLLLTMDRDSGETRVLAEQIEGYRLRAAGGRGLG